MKLISTTRSLNEEFDRFSEPELWREIQNSNHSAFSYLYRRYIKELFRYGHYLFRDKKSVEDAIHDVFVNIWASRESNSGIRSLKAYLYTSVRREVLRKKSHRAIRNGEDTDSLLPALSLKEASYEENIISDEKEQELIRNIREIINTLSDRQREIIFLRFYQNISYAEISSMLGIDQNYAYNLASKAFASIKSRLKELQIPLFLLLLSIMQFFY